MFPIHIIVEFIVALPSTELSARALMFTNSFHLICLLA